ncbi:MAG: hypothetical protein ISS52_07870 [Dehalococcoidia bacterium]|nr:hypothetical protein [Dehalococcoidia bacterium]
MRLRAFLGLRVVVLVALLLPGTMVWTSCWSDGGGSYVPPPPPPEPGAGGQPSQPTNPAQLVIHNILMTNVVQAGEFFDTRADIRNVGGETSGRYSVGICLEQYGDIGNWFGCKQFSGEGVVPGGHQGQAPGADNFLVNQPGTYSVVVTLVPDDGEYSELRHTFQVVE